MSASEPSMTYPNAINVVRTLNSGDKSTISLMSAWAATGIIGGMTGRTKVVECVGVYPYQYS